MFPTIQEKFVTVKRNVLIRNKCLHPPQKKEQMFAWFKKIILCIYKKCSTCVKECSPCLFQMFNMYLENVLSVFEKWSTCIWKYLEKRSMCIWKMVNVYLKNIRPLYKKWSMCICQLFNIYSDKMFNLYLKNVQCVSKKMFNLYKENLELVLEN